MKKITAIFVVFVLLTSFVFNNVSIVNAAITDNLVSYWKLDETGGTRDDAHSTNDLTDNNTVMYATGKINNGADLEASTSEWLSTASSLGITGNLSISGWFKPEVANITQVIIGNYTSSANRGFILYVNTSGFLVSTINEAANGSDQSTSVANNNALSAGTFYYITMTYTASTGTVRLYVNGSECTYSIQTTNATAINNPGVAYTIGRNEGTFYLDGVLDELGIWTKVLSSSEITELYASGSGLAYPFTGTPAIIPIPNDPIFFN